MLEELKAQGRIRGGTSGSHNVLGLSENATVIIAMHKSNEYRISENIVLTNDKTAVLSLMRMTFPTSSPCFH